MSNKHITVLVDNESWILPFAQNLVSSLRAMGFIATLVRNAEEIQPGWINFMLGCTRIVGEHVLQRNQHNLVVHESKLPLGRGFAPMAWQILEGENVIPICLLEAASEVDAGDIWLEDVIDLQGHELCDEWRTAQGKKTIEICLRFVSNYPNLKPRRQCGDATFYPRRRPEDSQLDTNMTLKQLFPLLRVVDNKRYPAFFEIDGHQYAIKIQKQDN